MERQSGSMQNEQSQGQNEWEQHMGAVAIEAPKFPEGQSGEPDKDTRINDLAERVAQSDKMQEFMGEAMHTAIRRWFAELPAAKANSILDRLEADGRTNSNE